MPSLVEKERRVSVLSLLCSRLISSLWSLEVVDQNSQYVHGLTGFLMLCRSNDAGDTKVVFC